MVVKLAVILENHPIPIERLSANPQKIGRNVQRYLHRMRQPIFGVNNRIHRIEVKHIFSHPAAAPVESFGFEFIRDSVDGFIGFPARIRNHAHFYLSTAIVDAVDVFHQGCKPLSHVSARPPSWNEKLVG